MNNMLKKLREDSSLKNKDKYNLLCGWISKWEQMQGRTIQDSQDFVKNAKTLIILENEKNYYNKKLNKK